MKVSTPSHAPFTFSETDRAACDAIIAAEENAERALEAWLKKDQELHSERYANRKEGDDASAAAWAFFDERCEALGLMYTIF